MAWLTILIEVAGGLTTLVGLAIPLFALPMTAVLIIAMLKVHLQFGFSSIKLVSAALGHPQFGPPGYECDLLYLACIAALVMGGPGPLAIDTLLFRNVRLRQ
jgi:putative oxidoreductase